MDSVLIWHSILYLNQSEKLLEIKPSLVILVRINAHLISSDVQSNIERKSKACIFSVRFNQRHYKEVAQEDILMEQKMWFGLVLSQLVIRKKPWTDYEQLLRAVFSCFWGQFSNLNVPHKGLLLQDWVFRLGWQVFLTTYHSIDIFYAIRWPKSTFLD